MFRRVVRLAQEETPRACNPGYGRCASKMIGDAGGGTAVKSPISGVHQGAEIRIRWRCERSPRAGPDRVPAEAVEPAVGVRAGSDRQHHGGRKAARRVPDGLLQGLHQLDIQLDLRALIADPAAESSDDVAKNRPSGVRTGRDRGLRLGGTPLAENRSIEAAAKLPPIPGADRIEPSPVAERGGVARGKLGEPDARTRRNPARSRRMSPRT